MESFLVVNEKGKTIVELDNIVDANKRMHLSPHAVAVRRKSDGVLLTQKKAAVSEPLPRMRDGTFAMATIPLWYGN